MTHLGLSRWTTSQPSPMSSMVPVELFSMTMSVCSTSRREQLEALGRLGVHAEAPLGPRRRGERRRHLAAADRADEVGVRPRLDLDDVGPVLGQHPPGLDADPADPEVHDPDAVERPGGDGRPVGAAPGGRPTRPRPRPRPRPARPGDRSARRRSRRSPTPPGRSGPARAPARRSCPASSGARWPASRRASGRACTRSPAAAPRTRPPRGSSGRSARCRAAAGRRCSRGGSGRGPRSRPAATRARPARPAWPATGGATG